MMTWPKLFGLGKTWEVGRTSTVEWVDSEAEKAAQAAVCKFEKEIRLAVYKEKYSNYRHLDTLRWQVPGLAFAVGGALLSFAAPQNGVPSSPVLALYGVFALLCARLMYRVGVNLRANNVVLRRYGLSLGDDSIPPPPRWHGASLYVELFLAFVGLASLAVASGWWPVQAS